MQAFSDNFVFTARTGLGMQAVGDWHGDHISVYLRSKEGDRQKAIAVLERLYDDWEVWESKLIDSLTSKYGDPGAIKIVNIDAYDSEQERDAFSILFTAANLFDGGVAYAAARFDEGYVWIGDAD